MLGRGKFFSALIRGWFAPHRCPGSHRLFTVTAALLLLASTFAGVIPALAPLPVAASHAGLKLPVPAGAAWTIGQGYNTRPTDGGTHWNCDPAVLRDQPTRTESCRAHYQYKFSFDLTRADGNSAGQPVLAPADGTIRWIDLSTGGMSIDLGDGYAFAFFHANLVPGLDAGQRVQRGQRLGSVLPPGQGANGGWPHLHVTLWRTSDGGNWSRIAVPFTDDHAFEGYDFPFLGDSSIDQYRGRTLNSTNQEIGGATPSPTLSAPVLQGPATGTSYRTYAPRPNLTWSPVSGATQYQVVVNDGQMLSPWLSGTTWAMPTLTNGQYAWQVRARSSAGVGPLSPKWVIWVDTSNATPPPTPPPSGSLGIKASPTSGQVGSSASVTGTGFGAGETVRIYLDSASSTPIGAVVATSVGSFAATITVPNASGGDHRFIARGMSTGRLTATAFRVTPSLQRTPYSGTPGTAVTVTVRGFGAYESVRLNWDTASGQYLGAAQTNAAGTGATTIRIPQASVGWHDYVGTGSRTGYRGYGAINVLSTGPTDGGGSSGGGQIVGPGSYRITATREGLVGGTTSSGHVIVPYDHFVSLPACTATSCPWLTPGVRHDRWGLRVECGTRCYVRVKNAATGICSVAPIYDVGPWFTNDDWWNPASSRILNTLPTTKTKLPQGYTGADAARDGVDVGYGKAPSGIGISNKGYEVGNRASLDIADGTWVDLGIAMSAGIAPNGIIATMLWQSGEDPLTAARACGQSSPDARRGASGSPTPTPTPQPPPPPPAPTTPAKLVSSVSWAKVGQSVTLTGTGFMPGERVTIKWDGAITYKTLNADNKGNFGVWMGIPTGAYGSHSFVAQGSTSNRVASAVIRIGASLTRTPTSGTPGTRVYVVARGYGAYEHVRLSWNSASGPYLGTISTNGLGVGSGSIVIPNDSAGWHDYVGIGSRTGAAGYGAIQVISPAPTAPPASVSISMSPRAASPGSFVTVAVSGFAARERIDIIWGPNSQPFGSTTTDGAGSRTFGVPVPATAQGPLVLTVRGVSSGRIARLAVVVQPRLILSPASGPMRTDVSASGLGFTANHPVAVVWRKPGGTSMTVCVTRTDVNGTFKCKFIAPASTGTGTFYVTAVTGSVGITTTFNVTGTFVVNQIGPDDGADQPEATATPYAGERTPRVSMPTPASGERILRGRESDVSATDIGTPEATPTETARRETAAPTAGENRSLRDADTTVTATVAPTPTAAPVTATLATTDTPTVGAPAASATPTTVPSVTPDVSPPAEAAESPAATEDAGRSIREPADLSTATPATEDTAVVETEPAVEPTATPSATHEADRSIRTPDSDVTPTEELSTPDVSTPVAMPSGTAEADRSIRTETTPASSVAESEAQVVPTEIPTAAPTLLPTETPTEIPTPIPTVIPTETPIEVPTELPTLEPTQAPVTIDLYLVPASDISVTQWSVADADATPSALDPSAGELSVGGSEGAVTYLTFQVDGITAGTVVDARLVVTGAGDTAGTGGTVTAWPGIWVDEWTATAETSPGPGTPVVNAAGIPSDAVWLTPGVESVVDVTGTVSTDGTITFVLAGTAENQVAIASRESATPPRLVLTVVHPASP
jgi:hypothetical protein